MHKPRHAPVAGSVLTLVALGLSSCTTEGYRREADAEVYSILAAKRTAALGKDSGPAAFVVESGEDSLRNRLLARIAKGERPKLRLTLQQALEVAAENSRQFQDQKEALYLSALSLTGQRNRYSTIFAGSNNSTVGGTGDDTADGSTQSSISASKILASGASVLGSFVNTFFRVFTSGGGWNATSLLSLSVTQPLLRGFGKTVALEPLTQAERNTVYAVRDYERFRRTFSVNIVSSYLNVLEQADNLENQKANTLSLTENTRRTKALADAGRLPKFQVDQTEQQEFSAQDREIATNTRYENIVDSFKITLGLPMDVDLELDDSVFQQLRDLGVGTLSLSEDDALELALEQRLDLKNSAERTEDSERRVTVAADALKMGLDLTAGVGVPNERSEKAGKLNWHRLDWEVGLQLDLPLNKVNERNVFRQALLDLDAQRRAHSLIEDTIRQSVRDSLRTVQASYRSYQIQKVSVALATDRVKSTTMLIDAGRAATRDYLEAQQALLQSQNALTGALVDYVVTKLGLLRDLEILDVGRTGLSLDLTSLERWTDTPEKTPEPKAGSGRK